MIQDIMVWIEPVVLGTFIITLIMDAYELKGLIKRTVAPTFREIRNAKVREIWLTIFIIVELLTNIFIER
jgi:hypothetical protein